MFRGELACGIEILEVKKGGGVKWLAIDVMRDA
jgi:hypothetical protein